MAREIPANAIEKSLCAINDRVGDYLLPSGALKAHHRTSHMKGAGDEHPGFICLGLREIETEARVLTGVVRAALEKKPRLRETCLAKGGGHDIGARHALSGKHPHRAFAHFRGKLVRCLAHDAPSCSRVGASGKLGAVQ